MGSRFGGARRFGVLPLPYPRMGRPRASIGVWKGERVFMQASVSAGVSARLANMGIVCACLIAVSHSGFYGQMDGASRWLQQIMTWGFGNLPVPFFFLASGYFLAGHAGEAGWWGREARKRVRSLLVPYFLWMVLWSAFAGCLAAARHALAGEALFAEGNPAGVKAALASLGILRNRLRLPLVGVSEGLYARIGCLMRELNAPAK